jgi:autotransporter-associated beta strand protein
MRRFESCILALLLAVLPACLPQALAAALPVTVDPGVALTGSYSVEWNTTGDFESWTTSQVSPAVVGDGKLSGNTSGTAARVIRSNFSGPDLDLGFNDYLELRIQVAASHTGDIRIAYGTSATTGFSPARVLVIPDALIPADGEFHTYRIDAGPEPWWRANLRDLRIEPSASSGETFAIDYLRVGDLPGDVHWINPEFVSDNEMTSKHFRFLWSSARAAQGVNATTARGALRNAEEAWQVYVKIMGYRDTAESTSSPDGKKYKTNFLCIHDGYWMSSTSGGFGYMNIEPSGLQTDPPTWIIPHELMHVFQHHNNNGHYSGQWETHANYGRERWIQHYQAFHSNRSNIEALGVRDGHFMISSGRNYYLSWPFLFYIDDNPDKLPDLADGMVKRLWQEGRPGEFWPATLDRLTPTTSLKDISGYYARRCATWDFSNQAAMTATLNNQDPTRNARHLFTDLIQRPDAPGWWRVPPNKAPAQGAYAMHELIPAGSGAGRVVTVNLQGLADSARGADWRASFITVSDTGVERYTSLWNNGSNSITLGANENKLYLSVAGTPDWYANGGFDEAAEPFRSHPSRSRFHYQVQVSGATPRERTNGSNAGMTQHSNGGGYRSVAVPVSVYIGPNARVTGGVVSGNARVEDYALVSGGTVNSGAVISGHAWVRGGTVTGNARVRDWAIVDSGVISGNARVLEHATVEGNLQDTAVAKGSAWHQGGTLSGNAIVDGDYMGSKSISNGVTFGHMPFVGIPDRFTTPTPTGHYVSYDFSEAHESRVLDRHGVTDSFPIGSPTWTATDWKRKGFLSFSGSGQYVALDRSVADTRAFTFAVWVKPSGGAANQAVLWLGASSTKRLYFTANNGSGQSKFSIVNGGTEQSLTSAALPAGVWSHVALVLDGGIGTLQVNGSTAASGPITITPDQLLAPNTTTGLQHNYLARSEGVLMPMFQGSIDDVQFFSSALTSEQLAAVTVPLAGDLLLSDNFNSASYGASTFNATLGSDQQGLLAPIPYSIAGHTQDWQIQHGNGGAMLLAGWNGGLWGDLHASLNRNFATEANELNKPLKVEFDVRIIDSPDASNWTAFAIGSAQNAFVNSAANQFSCLFRHNGGTQQFASGGSIGSATSWLASGSTIVVILSDAAGAGSPFHGNGSVARLYVNGALAGTYTLAQMTGSHGYVSFQAYGAFAIYDNLNISVVSMPAHAVSYNGNGSTGGFAPIDSASPYATNSTVTVLGNTGGLVKTGYSFANWNSAADGSGIACNAGDAFSIAAPVTLYAQWRPGPDFIWDNGATTRLWTTTDANWLGAPWVNSAAHNAWFQAVGGAISLAPGLSAGDLNVGSASGNLPATSFSGGSLEAANLIMQGSSSNNGNYAANPTLTLNSEITLSGNVMIGRGNLAIAGGSLSADRIVSAPASADWGRLAISGGVITANNGVDGSVNTAATFQLELNGGTLETPSIRVANRDLGSPGPDSINDAHLIFNGGTLKAIGPDNPDFITLYGDTANGSNPAQAVYLQSGGAIIDTNGRDIGIRVKLMGSVGGAGGLTKNGGGTLTLRGPNSYTGSTVVNAGVLSLGNGSTNTSLADTAGVTLAAGATLNLNYSGTDIVNALSVGGRAKSPGIYSASNGLFITGPGTLTVLSGPPGDYDIWRTANSVTGGPDHDDDRDGWSNHFEYSFGLNPALPSGSPVSFLSTASGPHLTYTRRKQSLTGLHYSIWVSSDLMSWTVDSGASQSATTIPGTGMESVAVSLSPPMVPHARRFVRISASAP